MPDNPYSNLSGDALDAAVAKAFPTNSTPAPNPYSNLSDSDLDAAVAKAFPVKAEQTQPQDEPGKIIPFDNTPAAKPEAPAQTPNANSWLQQTVQGNPAWAEPPKQPPLLPPVQQQKPFNPMLPVPPKPGYMGSVQAAASAVPNGLISPFEQAVNAGQFIHNHVPFGPMGNMSPAINAVNQMTGAPPQPYMDATGQYNRTPQDFLGGQTPTQAQATHPYAAMAGNLAGGLPFAALGPAGMAGKAPLLGKIAAGAGIGAGYGGLFGGLDEAGNQIKANDSIDVGKVARAMGQAGLAGAALGGLAGGAGHAIGRFLKGIQRGKLIKAAKAQGQQALERHIANQRGNVPFLTPEQEEYLAKGGTLPMPKDVADTFNRELRPQEPKPAPKLIEKKPIVPPSPAERERMGKEGYTPPFKLHVEENELTPPKNVIIEAVDKEVEKFFPEESWRQRRSNQARPATPVYEDRMLRPLAESKLKLDEAEGQLYGAIEQLEGKLHLEPKSTRYIKPELDKLRVAFIKEHGGKVTKTTPSYLEATLAPGHEYPKKYKFKSEGLILQMRELRELVGKVVKERALYDKEKAQLAKRPDLIRENDTVQTEVKDEAGNTKLVNIRNRKQAAPGGIEFPTADLQRQYEELIEKLEKLSGPYYVRTAQTFRALINKELKSGNQTLEYLRDHGALDWFNDLGSSTQAKVILTTGLAASMYLNNQQGAQAAPPPNIIGKVLTGLAKAGWHDAEGFRPITRITGTQVTSDMIRAGFDTASRAFSGKRDAYLAALRRTLAHGKEMTEAEHEAFLAEKKKTGKEPDVMKTSLLKGWSQLERQKLADAQRLHKGYLKELKGEIERVDKLGAKHEGIESLFGMNRYRRALQYDLGDLTGLKLPDEGAFGDVFGKMTGSGIQSLFYGNYRAAAFHFAEAAVAYGAKYPKASAQVLHGLATNPVYRDFAIANAPKGMFQRVLEGENKFEFQKKIERAINEPLDKAIKSLPGGDVLHEALSAQLPERGKLGLGATISAQHNAEHYPGGPEQFMKDWLANAKDNKAVPPQRQPMFAKVEIKNFIDDNKSIMNLPDGLIKERTMFQRHGALMKAAFPFLRAITQQTRFFANLTDDLIQGVREGDRGKIADSVKAILLGHVVVASVAGSHVLPNYVWSILESVDKEGADHLRDAIDDGQKVIAGGTQMQDFGIKYAPYMRMPNVFVGQEGTKILRGLANPKDKKEFVRAITDSVAMSTISRIGPQGTMNLEYLADRLQKGMQGYEDYKKYNDNPLMDLTMKRPFAQKTFQRRLPFDVPQGLAHWLLKIENPLEVQANKVAEHREGQLMEHDIRKIQANWQRVLAK